MPSLFPDPLLCTRATHSAEIHQEWLGHVLAAENRAHLCLNLSSLQDPTAFGNLDSLAWRSWFGQKFSSVGWSQLTELSPDVDDWGSVARGRGKIQVVSERCVWGWVGAGRRGYTILAEVGQPFIQSSSIHLLVCCTSGHVPGPQLQRQSSLVELSLMGEKDLSPENDNTLLQE